MPSSTEQDRPFLQYTDDPTSTEKSPPTLVQHVRQRANIVPCVLVCFFTSIFWVLLVLIFPPTSYGTYEPFDSDKVAPYNVTTGLTLTECGSNMDEALAAGCKYDVLLNHWVPEPCYDREFIDEYKDDHSWTAFEDESLTIPIPLEEMPDRDHYWTSIRDHVNHCGIIWRKQYYVLFEQRGAYDTMIVSPGHTDHCSQYLMDAMDWKGTEPTKVAVGFGGCWVRES